MMTQMLTREGAREAFAASGLDFRDLDLDMLDRLGRLLAAEMEASNALDGELRMDGSVKLVKRPRKRADFFCKSDYFDKRQAITFYGPDDTIGFAGWASEENVQPILRAFHKWIAVTASQAVPV